MTVKEMSKTIAGFCCGRCEDCRLLDFIKKDDGSVTNCFSYKMGNAVQEAVVVNNYEFLFGKTEVEPVPEAEPAEHDPVNHPSHYCREGGMESIDEMVAVFGAEAVMNFCLCNVWKYRYRASDKNGEEDLKKSDWYMKKYLELKDGLV